MLGEGGLARAAYPYQVVIPETNYIQQTTKADSSGCIYIFVHTHTYMCILLHTVIINEKGYQFETGRAWERLEGGYPGQAGERKRKEGSDVILFI